MCCYRLCDASVPKKGKINGNGAVNAECVVHDKS